MLDPALLELAKGDEGRELEVLARLREGAEAPPELRVVARMGDIVTGRVRLEALLRVRASPLILSLKAGRAFSHDPPEPDEGLADPPESADAAGRAADGEAGGAETEPAPWPERGRGILMAFLDSGCDFAHPHFRNAAGGTRLLALWDQRGPSEPGLAGNRYGYGTLHCREEIDAALLEAEPYAALGYDPSASDYLGIGSHGTHVMDIAAGTGSLPGSRPGLAPEAELLFVHLAASVPRGREDLGDSVRLLEAIDFCLGAAGSRPLVLNMSLGACGGAHDGMSLVEQAMDWLLEARPGTAIVQSAGNYYRYRTHASGHLALNRPTVLTWEIPEGDRTTNELELWYSREDLLSLELSPPSGSESFVAPLESIVELFLDGVSVGKLYHRERDSATSDNHVDIFLYPEAPCGAWVLRLLAADLRHGGFHAWIERDSGGSRAQSRFSGDCATRDCTLGTIACGKRTIAVGAYDSRRDAGALADFSSSGPTRDNRRRPDLLAPGVGVLAARSTPAGAPAGSGGLTRMSGTSMASPRVAGAVALILEAAGGSPPIGELRCLLLGACVPADGLDPERSGNGRLNVAGALELARARRAGSGAEAGAEAEAGTSEGQIVAGGDEDREGVGAAAAEELFRGLESSRPGRTGAARRGEWPALVFDLFCGIEDPALAASLGGRFLPLALPGARWKGEAEAGDLLIRRALGEGLIASVRVTAGDDSSFGLARGFLPRDCLVLRRRPKDKAAAEAPEAAEAPGLVYDPDGNYVEDREGRAGVLLRRELPDGGGGRRLAKDSYLADLDTFNAYTAAIYGETSGDRSESIAIADVIRNRAAASGRSALDIIANSGVHGYAPASRKATRAGQRSNADARLRQSRAAAIDALSGGADLSQGAYFWDGGDIANKDNPHRAWGLRYSQADHDHYGTGDILLKPPRSGYFEPSHRKRGSYDHMLVSTAHYGGSIFWKYAPEAMAALGLRAWP